MPELPEVETIRRSLLPRLEGKVITGAELRLPRLLKIPGPDDFISLLPGKEIMDLSRRGKYLLFHLSADYRLIFHLRMTGRLLYFPANTSTDKHTHLILQLNNGHQLCFHDMRTFGMIYLMPKGELTSWGFPPLTRTLAAPIYPHILAQALTGRRASIKAILLNQRVLADWVISMWMKSLFRAGIYPGREAVL